MEEANPPRLVGKNVDFWTGLRQDFVSNQELKNALVKSEEGDFTTWYASSNPKKKKVTPKRAHVNVALVGVHVIIEHICRFPHQVQYHLCSLRCLPSVINAESGAKNFLSKTSCKDLRKWIEEQPDLQKTLKEIVSNAVAEARKAGSETLQEKHFRRAKAEILPKYEFAGQRPNNFLCESSAPPLVRPLWQESDHEPAVAQVESSHFSIARTFLPSQSRMEVVATHPYEGVDETRKAVPGGWGPPVHDEVSVIASTTSDTADLFHFTTNCASLDPEPGWEDPRGQFATDPIVPQATDEHRQNELSSLDGLLHDLSLDVERHEQFSSAPSTELSPPATSMELISDPDPYGELPDSPDFLSLSSDDEIPPCPLSNDHANLMTSSDHGGPFLPDHLALPKEQPAFEQEPPPTEEHRTQPDAALEPPPPAGAEDNREILGGADTTLASSDQALLWAREMMRWEKDGSVADRSEWADMSVCEAAAREGALEPPEWEKVRGFRCDDTVCRWAVRRKDFGMLLWAVDNGCPCSVAAMREELGGVALSHDMVLLIVFGQLFVSLSHQKELLPADTVECFYYDIFRMYHSAPNRQEVIADLRLCFQTHPEAVVRLSVLNFLRKVETKSAAEVMEGHWCRQVLVTAAKRDEIRIVKWLMEMGCPRSCEDVFLEAARKGDLPMLQWLHANGWQKHENALAVAVDPVGDFRIIEWLLTEAGCPLRSFAYTVAARQRSWNHLEWLLERGRPSDALDDGWNWARDYILENAKLLQRVRRKGEKVGEEKQQGKEDPAKVWQTIAWLMQERCDLTRFALKVVEAGDIHTVTMLGAPGLRRPSIVYAKAAKAANCTRFYTLIQLGRPSDALDDGWNWAKRFILEQKELLQRVAREDAKREEEEEEEKEKEKEKEKNKKKKKTKEKEDAEKIWQIIEWLMQERCDLTQFALKVVEAGDIHTVTMLGARGLRPPSVVYAKAAKARDCARLCALIRLGCPSDATTVQWEIVKNYILKALEQPPVKEERWWKRIDSLLENQCMLRTLVERAAREGRWQVVQDLFTIQSVNPTLAAIAHDLHISVQRSGPYLLKEAKRQPDSGMVDWLRLHGCNESYTESDSEYESDTGSDADSDASESEGD